jgi:hypothetical protein
VQDVAEAAVDFETLQAWARIDIAYEMERFVVWYRRQLILRSWLPCGSGNPASVK